MLRRARVIAGTISLAGLGSLLFGAPAVLGSVVAVASVFAALLGGIAYAVLNWACRIQARH